MTFETKEAPTAAKSEKQRWEEETLAQVLEKTAERKARFEGVSLERSNGFILRPTVKVLMSVFPANSLTSAEFIPQATAAGSGPCVNSRASLRLKRPIVGLST